MKYITKVMAIALLVLNFQQAFAQTKEEGIKALEAKQYDQAIAIFNTVISKTEKIKKHVNLYYYLGTAQLAKGETAKAKTTFEKGITTNSKDGLNYVGLGRILMDEKKESEAKVKFDKALETQSSNPDVLIEISQAYLDNNAKDLDSPTKWLTKARGLAPNNPRVYIGLGDVYMKQKVIALALTNYEKAISLDKNFMRGYLKVGQIYFNSKEYEKAVEYYQKANKINPTYAPVLKELGEIYYLAKLYAKAKTTIKKYLDLTGNKDNEMKHIYAEALFLSKEYENTISYIKTIKKDTTSFILKRLKGYSLYETKQYDEALTVMSDFMTNAPKDYKIGEDYVYMGRIYQQKDNEAESIKNFEKALEIDPEQKALYTEIAMTKFNGKSYDDAAKYFQKAIDNNIDSENGNIKEYYMLGNSYYFNEKPKEAIKPFKKVTEINGEWIQGYLSLARAQSSVDKELKEALALDAYKKVIEIGNADKTANKKSLLEAYRYIANVYITAEHKNKEEAEKSFNAMLELDPDNKTAKDGLEFLKTFK